MLWLYELKKALVTQKGVGILILCCLLKILLMVSYPEQIDSRIALSRVQYDKFLSVLHGENTPKKSQWVQKEYAACRQTREMQSDMEEAHENGELTENEWNSFLDQVHSAELKINAAKIFSEKAEQFQNHNALLPPAHYIYEYGWQSIYTIMQLPDLVFVLGMLILVSKSLLSDSLTGMLPVLLAAKNGREQLFRMKLLALLGVCFAGYILSIAVEMGVFAYRGWLNDSGVPLYSVTIFRNSDLNLTLAEGYAVCAVIRGAALILLSAALYGLSVWIRSAPQLIFTGICVVSFPLLFGGNWSLFTLGGLLSGTRMLLQINNSLQILWISAGVQTLLTAILLHWAEIRFSRGI